MKHKLIGFNKREEKFLLRGTILVLKEKRIYVSSLNV